MVVLGVFVCLWLFFLVEVDFEFVFYFFLRNEKCNLSDIFFLIKRRTPLLVQATD